MNIDIDLDVVCTFKDHRVGQLLHSSKQVMAYLKEIEPIDPGDFIEIVIRHTKRDWQKTLNSKAELVEELYKYGFTLPQQEN